MRASQAPNSQTITDMKIRKVGIFPPLNWMKFSNAFFSKQKNFTHFTSIRLLPLTLSFKFGSLFPVGSPAKKEPFRALQMKGNLHKWPCRHLIIVLTMPRFGLNFINITKEARAALGYALSNPYVSLLLSNFHAHIHNWSSIYAL